MKITPLIGSCLLALASYANAAHEGWVTDFEAAKKQAAAENKQILADFTGSDWCHWCIKLSEEVFSKEEFTKGVKDQFVLLELDFPRDKSKQSEELQKQNAELQKEFQIQGFPTVILMDSKGRPFGQTGYQEGGPSKYLEMLKEKVADIQKRDEKLAAAEKTEGVEKSKLLVDAISNIPPPLHKFYPKITQAILANDPGNESGYASIIARQELEKQLGAAMQSGDSKKAITAVDQFITEHKPKGSVHQEILSMKASIYLGETMFDEAETLMKQIIAIDPESEISTMVKDFAPQFEQMKKDAAAAKEAKKEEAPKAEAKEKQ